MQSGTYAERRYRYSVWCVRACAQHPRQPAKSEGSEGGVRARVRACVCRRVWGGVVMQKRQGIKGNHGIKRWARGGLGGGEGRLEGGRRWESFPAISTFTSSSNSSTTFSSSSSTTSSANSTKRRHPRAPRLQHRVAQSRPSSSSSTSIRITHPSPPNSSSLPRPQLLSPGCLFIAAASPSLSPVPLSLLHETRDALPPSSTPLSPSPRPSAPFLRGSPSFCSAGRVLEEPSLSQEEGKVLFCLISSLSPTSAKARLWALSPLEANG